MQKQIKKIVSRQLKENIPGLKAVDAFFTEHEFEPILVFTEFYMSRPIFGPHPHAGISVMTYMLPDSKGSFLNRDSLGDESIIEPGGMHVTQAGSGIKHDETPTVPGVDCHGFQIWLNHASKDRMVMPKAFHASANEVPVFTANDMKVRVVQGNFRGLVSPIALLTKTTILDVTLEPNTTVVLDAMGMAFVYLIDGDLKIGDAEISNRAFVHFEEEGNSIEVTALQKPAHLLFVSGMPHHEPIVQGGPFVMSTNQQMLETQLRLQKGEMGTLAPL